MSTQAAETGLVKGSTAAWRRGLTDVPPELGGRLFALATFLLLALVLFYAHWQRMTDFQPRDTDDAMRLVQVRDWLAGQSWFDVSQHRVNPPWGGPMHWSRLVDLPLAGVMLALRPWLGMQGAEWWASVAVPLALLAAVFLFMHSLVLHWGSSLAKLSVVVLAASPLVQSQFTPLRIDHHGWQALLGLISVWGALHVRPGRGGMVAGLATALWLQISLEALPFAIALSAVIAARWVLEPDDRPRLLSYGLSLALLTPLLYWGLQGPRAGDIHCDALSPPYLGPLVLVGLALALAACGRGLSRNGRLISVGAIAVLASVAAVSRSMGGSACLGAFAGMDPLVRDLWLATVMEGLPAWRVPSTRVVEGHIPAVLGLLGLAMAWQREPSQKARRDWLVLLCLAAAALAMSVMVYRVVVLAQLLTLPGLASMIWRFKDWSLSRGSAAARVLLTTSLLLLTPVGPAALAALWPSSNRPDASATTQANWPDVQTLRLLPVSTLLAPIDLGPEILRLTHHRVLATPHHRNQAGLSAALKAGTSPPHEAAQTVWGTSAGYLLFSKSTVEASLAEQYPQGLWSQLLANRPPPWLEAVALPGNSGWQIYRILRPLQEGEATAKALAGGTVGRRTEPWGRD